MKTKKRNVETLRPSFYRSNIKYNCNLLFFDKRRVDPSLSFYEFLYICSQIILFLCWQFKVSVFRLFHIQLFFQPLFHNSQTISWIYCSWWHRLDVSGQTRAPSYWNNPNGLINWYCRNETFLTHANSVLTISHNIFWGTTIWAQYSNWTLRELNMKSHLGNASEIKDPEHVHIVLPLYDINKKKTCTVHRVTANVISFQRGGRFCLCTLALAHKEKFNGTTAACILSLYWYSIMAVLGRLNNIYWIVLHADHIFYCALMLLNVYVQLFTPCIVI